MRTVSFLLILLFGIIGYVLLPVSFININSFLGLPVISIGFLKFIGIILILLGLSTALYCSGLFLIFGKGTPVPIDPPKKLVVKGLYKYSRNPIYLAHLTVFLGEFLSFGHLLLLLYLFGALIVFHLLTVYHEEPILKKRFGKSYLEYSRKTPRWL